MDGLEQQLSQLLSNPNSMKQLQSMISSLGLGGQQGSENTGGSGQPAPPPPAQGSSSAPDLSALAGMLGALGNSGPAPAPASTTLAGPDAISMVTKLAPLLSQLNREDDSTRLLMALRPLLGEERRRKIDEAVKILQLMRLLPILRDMGGLPGLMPGLGS